MEIKRARVWLIIASFTLTALYVVLVYLFSDEHYKAYLAIIAILINLFLRFSKFSFRDCIEQMTDSGDVKMFRWLLIVIIIMNIFCSTLKYFPAAEPLFTKGLHQGYYDQAQPVGIAMIIGAVIFGVGMELASGCILGILTGIGDGSPKSFIAIATSIIGSTVGTMNPVYLWYSGLPRSLRPMKIHFGIMLAILLGLLILTVFAEKLVMSYKKTYSSPENVLVENNAEAPRSNHVNIQRVVSIVTSILAGCGMGIYYVLYGSMLNLEEGLPIFGAKILQLCSLHPEEWNYFSGKSIPNNFLTNTAIVTNVGLALGGYIASTLLGTVGVVEKSGLVECIKGAVGGFLIGLGSRISNGCTVSCVIGGLASSSLHGLLWLICAIIGCFAMLKLQKILNFTKKESTDVEAYVQLP